MPQIGRRKANCKEEETVVTSIVQREKDSMIQSRIDNGRFKKRDPSTTMSTRQLQQNQITRIRRKSRLRTADAGALALELSSPVAIGISLAERVPVSSKEVSVDEGIVGCMLIGKTSWRVDKYPASP